MEIQTEKNDAKLAKKQKKYLSESDLKKISSMFLSDKKHANNLIDVLNQFKKPSETPSACVSAVENIFVEVLKRKDMVINDSESTSEAENQYKTWLKGCYEEAWVKLAHCLKKGTPECKLQALNSLFKLLSIEAKFPVEPKKKKKNNGFPTHRLKEILRSLSYVSDEEVLKRVSEFLNYKDVRCNVWIAAEKISQEFNNQSYTDEMIQNLIRVLSKLPKVNKGSDIVLCDIKNSVPEERVVKSAVEKLWKQLACLQHTCSPHTHQLLLLLLVEHIMPRMDNAIFLTDYLMDAMENDKCEISMLALQGIYNLVIKHNIEYPNIYGKLYQLFTPEVLNAKYKARLFVLADEFLRSTHLPLALVAGFAKRYSWLLLSASPPDMLVLLTSLLNLLIRHPDLEPLYHKPDGGKVEKDPYDECEKDPEKSGALQSQLWEVKLMQDHYNERVVKLAKVINNDLPTAEYQLDSVLNVTWEEMIKKEIKFLQKKIPQVAAKFQDKPLSSKMKEAMKKEVKLQFADFEKYFNFEKE